MKNIERYPAFPLIANDPYFSYWLPSDSPLTANPAHWTGREYCMFVSFTVDGVTYRAIGRRGEERPVLRKISVRATTTVFVEEAGGVELRLTFRTPALPDQWDILSAPITYVDYCFASLDGKDHRVAFHLSLPTNACYQDPVPPKLDAEKFHRENLYFAYAGRCQQNILSHSADGITIDWGYLYLVASTPVEAEQSCLRVHTSADITPTEPKTGYVMLGYDDIASINYFGVPCRAWYTRNGANIVDAFLTFANRYDEIADACAKLDDLVWNDAMKVGGEDYARICAAAWRHTFAAHKLIATPAGEPAFLSKENNSNGCIGTVDLSYPSAPLFLKYCPELVNALCRPVLEFANMPVWKFDYAPHDVGRYPYATGQIYAFIGTHRETGDVMLPVYLYGPDSDIFNHASQMPVEESGNLLIILSAAVSMGASSALCEKYRSTLDKWVCYLDQYGEDPGNQLCTDDFAGHLEHNVNLAAKALMGMEAYSRLLKTLGDEEQSSRWARRSREMADSFLARVGSAGNTPLTFDGKGWSMKYNLVWDLVFDYNLLPKEFYKKETESYLPRMNRYGLPLDSRKSYTKSDWLTWCAAMAQDDETRRALLAPLALYLTETPSRVAFSDWYDTITGEYEHFIGRSVQGGVFMPMLTWREKA